MKKRLFASITIGLTATFLFTGCTENKNSISSSEQTSISTKEKIFKEVSLPKVGILEYTITDINQEQVDKKDNDKTNAEYNFSGFDDFPEKYYRSKINYKLKNTSDKSFDLSTFSSSVVDDEGNQYDFSAGEFFMLDENSNGVVQPGATASGSFVLLSKEKPNLDSFSINVTDQFTNDDNFTKIGDSASTTFKN